MRAAIKPPVLNWLIIKFYKYSNKIISNKISMYWLKDLLVFEKNSVYFCMNWFIKNITMKNLLINYEELKFQSFFFSLLYHTSAKFIKIFNSTFFFLIQILMDYIRFFYRWDITIIHIKNFFFKTTLPWWSGIKFLFFKDIIFTFNKQIFQWSLTKQWHIASCFFFNIFYFILNLSLETNFKLLNLIDKKLVFYYSLDFEQSLFSNKFDELYSFYNKYLTRQTGVLKNTKYYVNWNYIFTTSTQMLKSWKIFSLNFFFWNKYFHLFSKYKWKKEIKKITPKDGIYTWNRNTIILPFFINKIFHIHNGIKFIWIRILPGMVGCKLGQFSFTWKIHSWNANLRTYFKNLL